MPTYLKHEVMISFAEAMKIGTVGLLVLIVFIPFMGWLSDQWGRKPIFLFGSIALILFSYPLFHLIETREIH